MNARVFVVTVAGILASTATGRAQSPPHTGHEDPAVMVVARVGSDDLRRLLDDVLKRNPNIAVARAEAEAAAQVAPQTAALPDPVAGLAVFLSTPETRVGPQRATASVSQRFPWAGTLDLRERVALDRAAASVARYEETRLEIVTAARRLVAELAFLDAHEQVLREDLGALSHFEELARARYATGIGLGQAVVKIQAEITRTEAALLDLETQRTSIVSRLNALRDRPKSAPLPDFELPGIRSLALELDMLQDVARRFRPRIAAARASVAAAESGISLAEKSNRPDLTAGVVYTLVGHRDDADPPDNGQDIIGLTGSLNVPVRRAPREAVVAEAVATRHAAEQRLRALITDLDSKLEDLLRRIPLIEERGRLFDRVLTVQAREALDSAISAYAAGTLGALDLLDAERVVLQVGVATARARADWVIAVAELEGTVGASVTTGGAS